jgi:hypothetical protein
VTFAVPFVNICWIVILGGQGFLENAMTGRTAMIGRFEAALGLADIAQFTAQSPPKA